MKTRRYLILGDSFIMISVRGNAVFELQNMLTTKCDSMVSKEQKNIPRLSEREND